MIFQPQVFDHHNKKFAIKAITAAMVCIWIVVFFAAIGLCEPVDQATARTVADNIVRRHMQLYGQWNASPWPVVADGQVVQYQGRVVAYNFSINPSGHVLVAADDLFSPVPLYSTRSTFHPERADQPHAIESWIVPEQHGKATGLDRRRRSLGLKSSTVRPNDRIARAWDFYTNRSGGVETRSASTIADAALAAVGRSATVTVGPVMSTLWGQGAPFNSQTPAVSGAGSCTHTLTGCVATAWAQVLKYWEWPINGIGSHSYTWNSQTLTVDFSADRYDWANMPDELSAGSSAAEKEAVALLMYHMGVVAETDFGCALSESEVWADDVLDIFFRYKAMTFHYRTDDEGNPIYTADEWFGLFKTELDALRPVIFTIFSPSTGHEVVVDGYRQDTDAGTDLVHINFGWPTLANPSDEWADEGYYGFYDVSDENSISPWDVNDQYMITGIKPNYNATLPTVNAGEDLSVDERTSVNLIGSAFHDGYAIDSYQWRRVDDPQFTITNPTQASASFTAPSVSADTQFVFRLKATDNDRGVGFDQCIVTVRNIDAPPAPPPSSASNGGGGGGCFISAIAWQHCSVLAR